MLSERFWVGGVTKLVAVLVAVLASLSVMAVTERSAKADVISGYYNRQVTVQGNTANDVDTGIVLKAGDRVVVSTSGEINPGCLFCTGVGPAGGGSNANGDWPLPGQPEYALIGKTGGQYFHVGSGKNWIHQGGSDKLFLYINDIWTGDNSGEFVANIRVDRDIPLPETAINSGPSGLVNTNSAFFTYHGSSPEGGVSYQCSLDDRGFTNCPSGGQSYGGLSDGRHTFEVRAMDRFGRVDATPASRTWEVNTVTPDTVAPAIGPVTPAAGSTTRDRTPLIRATVRDNLADLTQANISLALDGRAKSFAYNTDTDKLIYQAGRLSYGKHSVTVRATDGRQNTATKTWSFKVVRRR